LGFGRIDTLTGPSCFHRKNKPKSSLYEGFLISWDPDLLKSKALELEQLQTLLKKQITLPIEKEEHLNTRCTGHDSLLKEKNSKKV